MTNYKNPAIAVVLPVYNTALYLRECLDSILEQTYKNFKVFAVDDGSTDDSGKILDEYSKKDSRFVVFHKKNGGVSSARNTALDSIEDDGEFDYISFVDSDDIITPSFLRDFVDMANKFKVDYLVCGIQSFTQEGPNDLPEDEHVVVTLNKHSAATQFFGLREWASRSVTKARFLSNKIFSTELIFGLRFNTKLASGEDQEFLIRTLERINSGVCFNTQNYKYRLRASSLTRMISSSEYEVLLFESILQSGNFSEDVVFGIERSIIDSWWSALRIAYITNNENGKKLCRDVYHRLLKNNLSQKIPFKFKKRFIFFSLGDYFLRAYFSFRQHEKNITIPSKYFK